MSSDGEESAADEGAADEAVRKLESPAEEQKTKGEDAIIPKDTNERKPGAEIADEEKQRDKLERLRERRRSSDYQADPAKFHLMGGSVKPEGGIYI